MIHVSHLTKAYPGRVAVDNLSFDVPKGQLVGFLGPNGAGKTTTMRMLSGFLPPTSGTATVGGKDVFRDSLEVRRQVGYMPENAPLYLDMTVREYLHFRAALKGMSGRDLRTRTGEVMDMCNVSEVRRRLISTLSKGYRQRVALADALLHRPPLLILDEPTNGLDPTQIRGVRELLRNLKTEHTVLLSTHILSEVEKCCDRVLMIHHGRVMADDTPQMLKQGLRAAGTVTIELQATGKEDAGGKIGALSGVKKVKHEALPDSWHRYVLRIESNTDVREPLQEMAMKEKWKVRELHRQVPSLEDVFIELAASDPPGR
jgi:ABC-2 type transport system ATP-binding protein